LTSEPVPPALGETEVLDVEGRARRLGDLFGSTTLVVFLREFG